MSRSLLSPIRATMTSPNTLFEAHLASLPLLGRGKVRDIFDIDPHHFLIVTTDRISAFDVILPDPIPEKGRILTSLSNFWFSRMGAIIPNHLTGITLEQVVSDPAEREQIAGRAIVVHKLEPLPVEAIVRGYLIGSGWKDYQQTGQVCGIDLPPGLRQAERLPKPIYTPSSKAETGQHDENISFQETVAMMGGELAEKIRAMSLEIYRQAATYAEQRGILIADTKMEFGLDPEGRLVLIDELLTPDSSRFWPADQYRPGISPPSFDKQYVRDYLEKIKWNKEPPPPSLPPEIVRQTAAKYRQAERRLTGR